MVFFLVLDYTAKRALKAIIKLLKSDLKHARSQCRDAKTRHCVNLSPEFCTVSKASQHAAYFLVSPPFSINFFTQGIEYFTHVSPLLEVSRRDGDGGCLLEGLKGR